MAGQDCRQEDNLQDVTWMIERKKSVLNNCSLWDISHKHKTVFEDLFVLRKKRDNILKEKNAFKKK